MTLEVLNLAHAGRNQFREATKAAVSGNVQQTTRFFNELSGVPRSAQTVRRSLGLVTDDIPRVVVTERMADLYLAASLAKTSAGDQIEQSLLNLFAVRRQIEGIRATSFPLFWDVYDAADRLMAAIRRARVLDDSTIQMSLLIQLQAAVQRMTMIVQTEGNYEPTR